MSAAHELHDWSADLSRRFAAAQEEAIVREISREFGISAGMRVEVRKPRWMPAWLFQRLMRSVIVTYGPVSVSEIP